MQESSAAVSDADRLLALLNEDKIHPAELDSAMKSFTDAVKNEVVARVTATFDPPPPARVLSRLLFIRTSSNQAELGAAYVANLRSPFPDARKASLQALQQLEHPALVSLALLSLRDDSDAILAVACQILVERSSKDPAVWRLMQSAYRSRAGKREYYLSNSILEAHGITRSSPSGK
jgi:hypothetical protein